jgi:hypothetical protein
MTITALTARAQVGSEVQGQDPAGPEADDGQWHPDSPEGAEGAQVVQAAPPIAPDEGEEETSATETAGQVEWINPSTNSALNPGGQITAQWWVILCRKGAMRDT